MDKIIIKEFECVLEDFTTKEGKVFKKLCVKCRNKDVTFVFVDDKIKLILDLLGYKIDESEILVHEDM